MMSSRFKEYTTRLKEMSKKLMTIQLAPDTRERQVTGEDFSLQLLLNLLRYAQKDKF